MDIPQARFDALLDERRLLHAEKLDMERGVQKSVLGFVSVGAVAAGLYFNHSVVIDPTTRARLILLLMQIEVVLALLVVALFTLMVTLAGYIHAIEGQINEILQTTTNIWESKIVGAAFWNVRAAGL